MPNVMKIHSNDVPAFCFKHFIFLEITIMSLHIFVKMTATVNFNCDHLVKKCKINEIATDMILSDYLMFFIEIVF